MYDVRCHWPLNRCLITEQQAIKILVLLKGDIIVFLQILYSLLLICYSRKNHLFGFLDIQCSFLPVIFQARIISVTQLIVLLSTSNPIFIFIFQSDDLIMYLYLKLITCLSKESSCLSRKSSDE